MGLTSPETAAVARLLQYNSNVYDPSTNPYGMDGEGYLDNAPMAWDDTGTATNAVARLAGEVVTDVATSAAAVLTTLGYKNDAATSAAAAIAAAVSTDYPFTTTAGTSTAYTVNFTPDRIVGDGFSMRLNFHTACGAAPTVSVDGGTAYGMVDASHTDGNGAFAPIAAGRIIAGMNLVLLFDSAINKFVVLGLPLLGSVAGISRTAAYSSINQTFALNDGGVEQYLTGTAARTWTLASDGTVNFEIDTDIPVFNLTTGSAGTLRLTTSSSVTIYSGGIEYVGGYYLDLFAGDGGRLKKKSTNYWIWIGDNRNEWSNV